MKMGSQLKLTSFIILITFYCTNAQLDPPDAAMANYLKNLMENYTSWLADKDPLAPIPDKIILNGVNVLDRVNVTLEIEQQYMEGHSKVPPDSVITAGPNLELKVLNILRHNEAGVISFGGRYKIINGVYRNDASEEKNFTGEGIWLLKTNEITESLTIWNFVLTEDDFIDIAPAEKSWYFETDWTTHYFEGLVDDDANQDLLVVTQAIGKVYKDYISRARDAVPSFQLMLRYWEDTVTKTKLSDIIRDWIPTTPPTTTPDSSGGIVMPFGLFITIVASLLTNIAAF